MLRFGLENLRFRRICFLYYGLVSIFSIPLRLIQDYSTLRVLLISFGIGVLITGITLPMLWIACGLIQKFDLGRRNILYPFALVVLVGAIRGAILYIIISQSNPQDNLEPFFTVVSSMIFNSIYFIVISTLMETILQRKERFERIFADATLLITGQGRTVDTNLDPKILYDSTLQGIRESVSSLNRTSEPADKDALIAASKVIQSQINEVLRPLSHRLWVNGMGQMKYRSFFEILYEAVKNLDFSVKYILGCQFFFGGYVISLVLGFESALFLVLGFQSALYVSTIVVIVSVILIRILLILREKLASGHFILGLTFLVLMGLLPVFISIMIRDPLGGPISVGAALLVSPILPGLILLVSAYRLVSRDRDFAISAASSIKFRMTSILVGDQNIESGIKLAEYFHNTLQSELFSIAKRLEDASQLENSFDKEEVVRSLEAVLSRDYQEISTRDLNVAMRIPHLISSWQGIADIKLNGIEILEKRPNLAETVSSVLEEMITNTIRYGQADKIQVELTLVDFGLDLHLTHNGKGEISKKSGLGSVLLAHYSETGVQLEFVEGKTSLKICIPL